MNITFCLTLKKLECRISTQLRNKNRGATTEIARSFFQKVSALKSNLENRDQSIFVMIPKCLKTSKTFLNAQNHVKKLFPIVSNIWLVVWPHLNYYLSFDVCACFCLSVEWPFYFGFFWIRSVQNGSNLIKLDQIRFLTNQKMLLYKVVTFLKRIKMAISFLIFLDQIRPKWIKLDQT